VEHEVTQSQSRCKDFDEQIHNLKRDKDDFHGTFQALTNEDYDLKAKIEYCEKTKNNLEVEKTNTQTDIDNQNQNLYVLEQDINTLELSNRETQHLLTEVICLKKYAEEEKIALENEIKVLKEEFNLSQSQKKIILTTILNKEREFVELNISINKEESSLNNIEEDIKTSIAKLNQEKVEKLSLDETTSQQISEITKLEEKNKELDIEKISQLKIIEEKSLTLENVNKEINKYRSSTQNLKKDLEELSLQQESISIEFERLITVGDELNIEIEDITKSNCQNSSNLNSLREKLSIEAENKILTSQIIEYSQSLSQYYEEIDELKKLNGKYLSELSCLKTNISSREKNNYQLKKSCDLLEKDAVKEKK